MLKSILGLSLPLCFAVSACATEGYDAPVEKSVVFQAGNGETVDAFEGSFEVPENRSAPDSRTIKVGYVRFPATGDNPGAPIVYLAGGPGGSGTGTAKGRRFPLFMAMREFGDVIAYDQRGTGLSNDTPQCVSSVVIPIDRIMPRSEMIALMKQSVEECAVFWRGEGVDPRGYTTLENARDLDVLRAHLGVEKITLWGISYGTHLALAAAKEMGPRIDKMVMTGAEGLDQTVKLPSRTDAYFDRLQAAIDADPKTKAVYPDIKALMRGVHKKLDIEPAMLTLKDEGGAPADFLLTGEVMQRIATALISDPERAAIMLQLYMAAEAGVFEPIGQIIQRFITPNAPEQWRVMPLAMDVASGISDARLARVNQEAKTALLGDFLNFPMPQLRGVLSLDLGDAFRVAPKSNIPTLLLTGTLDGRTYPGGQQEAFSGFSNLTTVIVVNAGHNLFMSSPKVTETIQQFMRDESIESDEIILPAPDFLAMPQ